MYVEGKACVCLGVCVCVCVRECVMVGSVGGSAYMCGRECECVVGSVHVGGSRMVGFVSVVGSVYGGVCGTV